MTTRTITLLSIATLACLTLVGCGGSSTAQYLPDMKITLHQDAQFNLDPNGNPIIESGMRTWMSLQGQVYEVNTLGGTDDSLVQYRWSKIDTNGHATPYVPTIIGTTPTNGLYITFDEGRYVGTAKFPYEGSMLDTAPISFTARPGRG